MERLAEQQEVVGKRIQQIVSNFNKDPKERKVSGHYHERLQRLDANWDEFESTDSRIRELPGVSANHKYFASNYYDSIASIYQKYREIFRSEIDNIAVTVDPKPMLTAVEMSSKSLLGKIRAAQSQLNRLLNGIKDMPIRPSQSYCTINITAIKEHWQQVQELHKELYGSIENPEASGYDTSAFLDLQDQVLQATIMLSEHQESTALPVSLQAVNPNIRMKLPKIELPKFDGSYLKWRQFHDLFIEIIHKQDIPPCEKLWYLRANLTNDAKALIKHLPLSEENYQAAWQLLIERFENPRLLANALITKLMSQPSCSVETSAVGIKHLHDTTRECIMGLENMGVSTVTWDPLLLHILTRKLDHQTITLYEQSLDHPRSLQTLKEFLAFLEARFQSLEAIGSKTRGYDNKRACSVKTLTSVVSENGCCISCNEAHPLFACKAFIKLAPVDRLKLVQKHNYCVNCMQPGHTSKQCTKGSCKQCSKRHNTLLHLAPSKEIVLADQAKNSWSKSTKSSKLTSTSELKPTVLSAQTSQHKARYMLLGTAIVTIQGNDGSSVECRAILDSGSQINILSERMCKRLKLSQDSKIIQIEGIGVKDQIAKGRVNVQLFSKVTAFSCHLEAFVLPKIISEQPAREINIREWNIPHNIQLADPGFFKPNRIDLLLGVEFYHELLSIGQIRLGDGLPILQNTLLGWLVAGKVNNVNSEHVLCGISTAEELLEKQIEQFWELDKSPDSKQHLSPVEKQCEAHFCSNTERSSTGRFIVRLPFSTSANNLGQSRETAIRRFHTLEQKFKRRPEVYSEYVKFMNEYLALGHMEEVVNVATPHYYLPHHCVLKPESSTTKLRVVFDASAKTSTNISLNDVLMKGPTVQESLFSILLRFRMSRFVLTADIEKMYRQIEVSKDDRNFQLIIWRSHTSEPLRTYRLNTVTYGTRAAPYLATKCLQRLARENQAKYPQASSAILRDCYVDDIMTGSDSIAELLATQSQLNALLAEAGFKLRKWCANHTRLLEQIPDQDLQMSLELNDNPEQHIKTLGMVWLPKLDSFRINAQSTEATRITKRTISSETFRIFDPLGIVAPIVVTAKIILQKVWKLKLDWDAALPAELHTTWAKFRSELTTMGDIDVPRHVFAQGIANSKQIHVFADASTEAYGAAIYIRSIKQDNTVVVRLLCAKSRVAPIKQITLPRLELCAAKLAVELAEYTKNALSMADTPTYFWTDSEIVLAWINSESSAFHTFVANRIGVIQELSQPSQWRHVDTKRNPADLLTRPIAPSKLKADGNLWFYGPMFLHASKQAWPPEYKRSTPNADSERKLASFSASVASNGHFIYKIQHGNSFGKLTRIVGYICHFINQCRSQRHKELQGSKQSARISTTRYIARDALQEEVRHNSLKYIIKAIQDDEFREIIKELRQHGQLQPSHPLNELRPFLDEHGIIRVGGRLEAANLTFDAKYQMLLPYQDPITKLIMEDLHKRHAHVGPQTLLSITRQKFWPLKGKIIARSIVHNCVRCTRAKPKMLSQLMGNLPALRVQPARPFINTGVDFCGPMYIHYHVRGKHPQKAYVAVFCCFATKAVHLELVSNLSTNAFLGALKRFIGRRGHCNNIFCDNATNFVGAKNRLEELKETLYSDQAQNSITSSCNGKGIKFNFIPPRAPHFGGLWEAAVKSAKTLLLKVLEPAALTQEMLQTALVEIEAILNSRPLTPMSSDPNDATALTPGHFLIGEPLTAQVDPAAQPSGTGLLDDWRQIQKIKTEFWQRWSKEYLHLLQHRYGWKTPSSNVETGTIVIIKDDNLPVMKWPLGRIVQVHKGNDGLVRVVDVKTKDAVLTRSIHRLAPLPVETKQEPRITTNESKGFNSDGKVPRRAASGSDTDETPRKKEKISRASLLTTLFIACLSLSVSPVKSLPEVINQPFRNHHGIYFENMGTLVHTVKEWKIIVYYDLSPYWQELESLRNGTRALQEICKATHSTTCEHLVVHFQQDEQKLQIDNSLFTRKRVKRGAFNMVGNLASSLFGVLDADYAKEMSATIDAIKTDDSFLHKLIKNQTSLIDSTINIFKIDQLEVEKRLNRLDQKIGLVFNKINGNGTNAHNIMNTLALELMAASHNLHNIQSAIINLLTDTHHGIISPLLLSPEQLRKEIHNIGSKLPEFTQLSVNSKDVLHLYRVMKAEGRLTDPYLTFTVRIPLIDETKFDLFKLTPIAAVINDSLISTRLSTNFLAVNAHRDTYLVMTPEDLTLCSTSEPRTLLCEKTGPTYHKGAQVALCEFSAFVNETSPKCQATVLPTDYVWNQLSDTNKWIYGLKTVTRLRVVCGVEKFQLPLNGSGLLTVGAGCVVKLDQLTITGHNSISTQQKITFPLNDILVELPAPTDWKEYTDEPYHFNLEPLDALKQKLFDETLVEPPSTPSHQINSYHAIPGYLSITSIIVILGMISWKYRHQVYKSRHKPTPAPRHSKTPDFCITV